MAGDAMMRILLGALTVVSVVGLTALSDSRPSHAQEPPEAIEPPPETTPLPQPDRFPELGIGEQIEVSLYTSSATDRQTIFVPDELLNSPVGYRGKPGFDTMADHLGEIIVLADGVECGRFSLSDSENRVPEGKAFEIGLESQASQCSRQGAKILFFDGYGREFAEEAVVERGVTIQLTNLAPKPPHTGSGISPELSLLEEETGTNLRLLMLGVIVGGFVGLLAGSGIYLRTRSST